MPRDDFSPVAKALREAGYVPIPRWWVTPDQLETIRRMAMGNAEVVNEIRYKVNNGPGSRPQFNPEDLDD